MFLSLNPLREANGCRAGEDIATVDISKLCTLYSVWSDGFDSSCNCSRKMCEVMYTDEDASHRMSGYMMGNCVQLRQEDRRQCVDEGC